jgi:hypothetical protein
MVHENLAVDERLLEEAVRLIGERTCSGVVQRAPHRDRDFGLLARVSSLRVKEA